MTRYLSHSNYGALTQLRSLQIILALRRQPPHRHRNLRPQLTNLYTLLNSEPPAQPHLLQVTPPPIQLLQQRLNGRAHVPLAAPERAQTPQTNQQLPALIERPQGRVQDFFVGSSVAREHFLTVLAIPDVMSKIHLL